MRTSALVLAAVVWATVPGSVAGETALSPSAADAVAAAERLVTDTRAAAAVLRARAQVLSEQAAAVTDPQHQAVLDELTFELIERATALDRQAVALETALKGLHAP